MSQVAHPECDKLEAVEDEMETASTFLDFILDRFQLCEMRPGSDDRYPVVMSHAERERLLCAFFEIDYDAMQRERRALVQALRDSAVAHGFLEGSTP